MTPTDGGGLVLTGGGGVVLTAAVAAVAAVLLWPGGPVPGLPRALPGSPRVPAASGGRTGDRRWLPSLLARAVGWRATRTGSELDELADLLEVMVPALRSGASVRASVEVAGRAVGRDGHLRELVEGLMRSAGEGENLAPVWGAAAASSDTSGLDFVARAWALSEQTGIPLSVALATAARSLRARRAAAQALAASTAGARASMTVLALLPATGPAIGLMFGLSPGDLYGASTVSALSLLVGALLGTAGWLWSRAILRRALRPETVGVR